MMDELKYGLLILLDLSAAFDTAIHNLLYEDMKKIGIESDAFEYLVSYIEGRTYCIQYA